MLCRECQSIVPSLGGAIRNRSRAEVSRAEALALLYCTQCGATLSPPTATETLLAKLSQLARFGLSAGARPILAERRVASMPGLEGD